MADRVTDTARFYRLLHRLSSHTGGPRLLMECDGRMIWPQRGVYFFFERGQTRSIPDEGDRVVRVGTHGLKAGSVSTLWGRLFQHRGNTRAGLGNHRGSIFRLIVGESLARCNNMALPKSWGVGSSRGQAARRLGLSPVAIQADEAALETMVSRYIGRMPFLWLSVPDSSGPSSSRGFIERNAIALLSGFRSAAIDGPSTQWPGRNSDRERVRRSGLWNSNHVDEAWDSAFLDDMEARIEAMAY